MATSTEALSIMNVFYSALAFLSLLNPAVGVGDCGCSSCSSSTLSKDASGYTVRDRKDWLASTQGKSENDACSIGKKMLSVVCARVGYYDIESNSILHSPHLNTS